MVGRKTNIYIYIHPFLSRGLCQNHVPRTGTNNYIPCKSWDIITCPCPWYLLLAQRSSYMHIDILPLFLFAQPPQLGLCHYLKDLFHWQCLSLYLCFLFTVQSINIHRIGAWLRFVVVNYWPILVILQGCFASTGAIIQLTQCQQNNPDENE